MICNHRESGICERYKALGYEFLKKGWPDFLFYDEKTGEIIFVEVKRTQKRPTNKMGLSPHQRKMREILSRIGQYLVEYVD